MKEREFVVTSSLFALLLVFWLGFLVHRSPAFAGSLAGGVLAITGSFLMLVPFAYLLVKRVRRVREAVTRVISLRTLLTLHVYVGLLGPILVILHTGHRFESVLGIALTAAVLLVALSGYVGRHLLVRLSKENGGDRDVLAGLEARSWYLQAEFRVRAAELAALPEQQSLVRQYGRALLRPLRAVFAEPAPGLEPVARLGELAEAIADVEYGIRTQALFKRLFSLWLRIHIAFSLALVVLLALHVWSGAHFGLRWFR